MNNSKIKFGGNIFGNSTEKKKKAIQYGDIPNVERDSLQELTELQIAFREKAKAEKELQKANTHGDFFSCIVFKTQDRRDRLFDLLGIKEPDLQYINGEKLIKALELKIEDMELRTPGRFKCNKEILELSIKPNF